MGERLTKGDVEKIKAEIEDRKINVRPKALEDLKALVPQMDTISGVAEMANAYHDKVVPAMAALRKPVDELEMMVDKEIWPVPTYGDLMFEV